MSDSREASVWNHYIDYIAEATQIDRENKENCQSDENQYRRRLYIGRIKGIDVAGV